VVPVDDLLGTPGLRVGYPALVVPDDTVSTERSVLSLLNVVENTWRYGATVNLLTNLMESRTLLRRSRSLLLGINLVVVVARLVNGVSCAPAVMLILYRCLLAWSTGLLFGIDAVSEN